MRTETRNFILGVMLLFFITTIGTTAISIPIVQSINRTREADTYVLNQGSDRLNVLYISDGTNDRLYQALVLDPIMNVTDVTPSELDSVAISTEFYDSILIEDVVLDAANITDIVNFNTAGGGLFIIMGPSLHSDIQLLQQLNLVSSLALKKNFEEGIMIENTSSSSPMVQFVEWNSAPEAVDFSIIEPSAELRVTVRAQYGNRTYDNVVYEKAGTGKVVLLTIWLVQGENKQITQWFYYNYLFYCGITQISGDNPLSYANWPYSPVPHSTEQFWIGILEVSLVFIAVFSFFRAFRKSKSKPQETYLKEFALKIKEQEERMQAKKKKAELEKEKQRMADWEEVGTHRQLSGFLFGFFGGFLLLIPQVILTGFVFPRFIMPYPAIAGMYDWAKNFFQALWTVFDLGTSVALAKFFSQYRIEKPEKAIRYVQIFIWWQMITGCIQTSIVAFLGSFIFPQTYLAHMSYLFIFNSLIQFPGWFMVLVFVFQGMQRTDYQLITNILQTAIFDLCAKYGFILLFRWIFSSIPQFGDAFGALLGYSVGQWVGEFLTFVLCTKLFKKLGFHPSTLFRVDFGKDELKEVLHYGWKYVLGAALVPLVHMFQAYLLSIWIFNYNAEWGYFSQILQVIQIAALVNLYTQGLLSGISESHSNGAPKLLQLNIIEGFKISEYMSLFILSSLLIVLGPFVKGAMGSDWAGAVIYIPFLILRSLWEPATWLGDKTFQATGFTKEMSISWVIEQGSRVIFLLLLMIPFQMGGLLMAWTLSLVFKVLYQWYIIRRRITRFKWYFWKCFGAQGIAAIINIGFLWIFTNLVFDGGALTAILIFAVTFFVFLPIYSFFTGWLGAWDPNTLREFDRASAMVSGVGFLARMLYRMAEMGAKHSLMNLHNRFTIDIYEEAIQEAKILTEKKKQLIL